MNGGTKMDFEDYDRRLVAIGKRLEKNLDDWEHGQPRQISCNH